MNALTRLHRLSPAPRRTINKKLFLISLFIAVFASFSFFAPSPTVSAADAAPSSVDDAKRTKTGYKCGGGDKAINTAVDFGCKGKGDSLIDMLFAIIRFLSIGVGLVIVGSLVFGGVQYTMSRGDSQATAAAVNRFQAVAVALLLYAFAYPLLNYLIPGQLLK